MIISPFHGILDHNDYSPAFYTPRPYRLHIHRNTLQPLSRPESGVNLSVKMKGKVNVMAPYSQEISSPPSLCELKEEEDLRTRRDVC